MNIFSGEQGLGAALTNPTELARRKGNIREKYGISYRGRDYPDVEWAYHALKTGVVDQDDLLMTELIACKFQQHTRLAEAVARRGGRVWLESCSHLTGARTESAQSWEGMGRASRFIRNLVAGYELAFTMPDVGAPAQRGLF